MVCLYIGRQQNSFGIVYDCDYYANNDFSKELMGRMKIPIGSTCQIQIHLDQKPGFSRLYLLDLKTKTLGQYHSKSWPVIQAL